MSRISIASYFLRVKNNIKDRYVPFGNFDGNNHDFLDVFKEYLKHRKKEFYHNEKSQKLMTVIDYTLTGRTVNGILEEGRYGSGSNIRSQIDKKVSYVKKKDDATMPPFYFVADIPKDFDEGIFLLQRRGNHGFKESLQSDLNKYLEEKFHYYSVELNNLVPSEFIKTQLMDNRITKLRFISFKVPSDISNALPGNVEEESFAELIVHAGRNQRIPLIKNLFNVIDKKIKLSEVIEIPHFKYDNVKVEIDINGLPKTLDMSNLNRIMPYFDVTGEVKIREEDGNPSPDSIDKVAKELLIQLNKAIPRAEFKK